MTQRNKSKKLNIDINTLQDTDMLQFDVVL